MNEDIIRSVVGDLYLRNISLQQQLKDLLAERDKLRQIVESLQSGQKPRVLDSVDN